MIAKFFLWATVFLFSFYFSGHLFDLTVNVPNWKSGEIADVMLYRDFYHQSSPSVYFAPLVLGTPIISLITLLLVWKSGGATRILVCAALVIALGVTVWTVLFFVPINQYISTGQYDPVELKEVVARWVLYDYLRLALVGIGLVCSFLASQLYKHSERNISKTVNL